MKELIKQLVSIALGLRADNDRLVSENAALKAQIAESVKDLIDGVAQVSGNGFQPSQMG